MEIIAKKRFARTAPDKLRLFCAMLKGQNVENALSQLKYSNKYAAKPLINVLKQAQDQAKTKSAEMENLVIKIVKIDEGPKLKRRRIVSQGRATAILKRMSHITIILSDDGNPKSEIRNSKQMSALRQNKK